MNRAHTETLVMKHEGSRDSMYLDTAGIKHIGIGFNLEKPGAKTRIESVGANYDRISSGEDSLTQKQINALFAVDLKDAIEQAKTIVHNFDRLPDPVQSVIVDMVFNLGGAGFAKFEQTIAAFEREDYSVAAAQMAQSLWAGQVKGRAQENIEIVMEHA